MPLEVSAVLDREAAIYLTGEVITIKVTLRNLAPKGRESLAWGSVQLTCERTMGAQVAFRDRPTTAISRSASTVYSSKPNVLFCDAELNHGESRQFTCEIPLPMHQVPPSFRGHLVRIIPSVGVDDNPKVEQNPFLIGSMKPATISQTMMATVDEITAPKRAYMFSMTNAHGKVATMTLFKKTFRLGEDVLGILSFEGETMMATVDEITAPKRAYMFSMTNAHGKVATMTLFKKTFRLGEDVLGILSFEDSDVPCVQYSVHLETIEQLAEDVVGEHGEVKSEGMMNIAVHSNDYVVCAFASESSFRLSIPMHAPPTFHTDTVHLKWRLRFEFVTSEPLINVVYGEVCKAPIEQVHNFKP
ncbi:Rgp1 protein [Ancylostoma duodenale]|uniref:Rgp1 protein n=1 Tax=Ancylostoma duodenale TaxID=51022 RepID=A0A0C2D1M1_9BILA|nr:Rgp1 protein [Ancylostoma duodenale]